MLETKNTFTDRLRVLRRKHRDMSNGYITQLRGDGLIVIKPRRARRTYPIRGLVLVLVGFFAFKAFAVLSLGDVTYTDRLSSLQTGTAVEQAGAWAMQIDPLTQGLVQLYNDMTR